MVKVHVIGNIFITDSGIGHNNNYEFASQQNCLHSNTLWNPKIERRILKYNHVLLPEYSFPSRAAL